MAVKRGDILPVVLIILAAATYLGGTALYDQQAAAYQAEMLQLDRISKNVTFTAPADAVHAQVSFTVNEEHTPAIYVNSEQIVAAYTDDRQRTETVPGTVLQPENRLYAEFEISNQVKLTDVTVYTPTQTEQALLWLTYLLAAGLLLYGAYRGGERIAEWYGRKEIYDTYVRQITLFLSIVAVTGAMTLGSQLAVFGALDQPLAQPMVHHAAEEAQQTFKTEMDAMYTRDRATACDHINASDCTISAMQTAVAEQPVASYRDIDRYFRNAGVVAMLQQVKQLKNTPFQSSSITEAPARSLTVAFHNARMSILTSWARGYTDDVTAACQNNSIGPERCYNIIASVLNEHNAETNQQPYPDVCPATHLTEQLNILQTQPLADDPALAMFQHTTYVENLPSGDLKERSISCSTIQMMPSTPIRELLAMVETLSIAAVYTREITTHTQEQTEQLKNTTLEAIHNE